MNRWQRRQVLDCGDEVFEIATLGREPARTGRAGPFGDAEGKAVNRFARHRTPRRSCARLRFLVPMRSNFGAGAFHEPGGGGFHSVPQFSRSAGEAI